MAISIIELILLLALFGVIAWLGFTQHDLHKLVQKLEDRDRYERVRDRISGERDLLFAKVVSGQVEWAAVETDMNRLEKEWQAATAELQKLQ